MKLYMAVTADKYELPCYVCDSPTELAKKYGSTPTTMRSLICRGKVNKKHHVRFISIEVEEDEDEI